MSSIITDAEIEDWHMQMQYRVVNCAININIGELVYKHTKLVKYAEVDIPEYIAAVEKLIKAIATYGVRNDLDVRALKALYRSQYYGLTVRFCLKEQFDFYIQQFREDEYKNLKKFRLFLILGAQLFHANDVFCSQREVEEALTKLKKNPDDKKIHAELERLKKNLDLPADLDVAKLVAQIHEKKYDDVDRLMAKSAELIEKADKILETVPPKIPLDYVL